MNGRPLTPPAALVALVIGLAMPCTAGAQTSSGMPAGSSEAPADTTATADAPDTARPAPGAESVGPYGPYARALEHLAGNSRESARAELENALALDSLYAPALSLLSKLDFEDGRSAEAVRRLEAARSRAQRQGAALAGALLEGLALHYDALNRPDLAAALLADPAIGSPESASLAVYLTLRGARPEKADELALAALKRDDKCAVNQNNYGITKLRAGDVEAAQAAFAAAVELDPSLPGPYYNLAILEKFYRLDDAAAASWLQRYREHSTADPDGLFEAVDGSTSAPPPQGGND